LGQTTSWSLKVTYNSITAGNTLRFHYKDKLINAVYYEIHTKTINTFCGKKEACNVKVGGTYSDNWVLND
jgi:hypothetical protein